MEQSRDRAAGGSINSPPWFDGGCEKYTQWKIYMKSYLYAQDEHVWNIVENCWKTPIVPAKVIVILQSKLGICCRLHIKTTKSLGAPFDEDKVVKKILRALPEKFHSKVTSIEDSFDIDDYPLDELIGNLKTYELRLKPENKSKGVAFKVVKGTEEEAKPLDLALPTKEFKKFLRNKSSSQNFNAPKKNFVSSGSSDNNAKSRKGNFRGNNSGKIKCYECGGYGHISTDCGNKKHGSNNNKYLLSTWSDDETQEAENVAFVSSFSLDSESDEGFSDDETTVRCKQLYKASKSTLVKNASLEDEVELLKAEKDKLEHSQTWKNECAELKNKIKMLELEEELKSTQEKFTKFEISSGTASKLFSSGKAHHDTFGLGYSGESSKSTRSVREMNPVVGQGDSVTKVIKDTTTRPRTKVDKEPKPLQNVTQANMHTVNKPVWIRNELNNCSYNHIDSSDSINANCLMACVSTDITSSHIDATCLVALTALPDKRKDFWYMDSGCSRHMTGDTSWFSSFQDECTTGSVTFGDGRKAKILAQDPVNTPGIPNLQNVLYVEGLTANLISVSHLADDYEDVWFKKQRCLAYFFVRSAEETFETWHRRLGHVNYQDLLKLSTKQCVRGLPSLSVLELLHMDLMGPAQIESIGGKNYMIVVVDDFSKYTWVNFLRDKAETFESFKGLGQRMLIEKQSTNMCLIRVRSDNGTEFKNVAFANYFHELGVSHEFSAPITPQKNGIVERKNRVLLDMARVMIHSAGISTNFWAEAISTACYAINRVFLRPGTEQTAYELWKGKKPNIGHFSCFRKSMLYLVRSRATRQADIDVDTSSPSSSVPQDTSKTNEQDEHVDSIFKPAPVIRRGFKQVQKDHSSQDVIGKLSDGLKTRSQAATQVSLNEVEGLDFDETFAHVARLESVRLLLAVACRLRFKLFQMEVKTTFLNGILQEEVYVEQPQGFKDPHNLDHIYRLKKALYGLK
ncbi:uncharacterized protein LOC133711405 [Rosa rugosa]|uniref:uncharacterized protein LOC133711405 n=1 Tax=Rosa rugosa TaxID=74645 RepID=UPI002B41371C|nr:uncharacterized protein LOC133711405 [Rosa rugosa]